MEDANVQHSYMHRVALGLAAAGGLVSAACIAALPESGCLAVAWVYYHAITMFGGAAVGALAYVAVDLAPPNVMRYMGRSKKPLQWFLGAIVLIVMVAGLNVVPARLAHAIPLCWHDHTAPASEVEHGDLYWLFYG